jgi:hypothetical protein
VEMFAKWARVGHFGWCLACCVGRADCVGFAVLSL